jgi:hypothetical protein
MGERRGGNSKARFHQGNRPVVAVRTRLAESKAVPAAPRNRINLSCRNSRFRVAKCTFGRRQVRHREPTASAHPRAGAVSLLASISPLTQIKTAPARERAYPCVAAARLRPRIHNAHQPSILVGRRCVSDCGTSDFLMGFSRCRSVVGLQFMKIHAILRSFNSA